MDWWINFGFVINISTNVDIETRIWWIRSIDCSPKMLLNQWNLIEHFLNSLHSSVSYSSLCACVKDLSRKKKQLCSFLFEISVRSALFVIISFFSLKKYNINIYYKFIFVYQWGKYLKWKKKKTIQEKISLIFMKTKGKEYVTSSTLTFICRNCGLHKFDL